MYKWLARGLGLRPSQPYETDYDLIYGLSRRSLDEWLAKNPQLAAEHKVQESLARRRAQKK